MKVTKDFILLARSISSDENDKSLSIFKIIDKFSFRLNEEQLKELASKKPGSEQTIFPVSYFLVSSWLIKDSDNTDKSFEVDVQLIDPKGKTIYKHSRPMTVPAKSTRVRVNMNIQGLGYTVSGEYKYKVTLKDDGRDIGEEIYEFPIDIELEKSTKSK